MSAEVPSSPAAGPASLVSLPFELKAEIIAWVAEEYDDAAVGLLALGGTSSELRRLTDPHRWRVSSQAIISALGLHANGRLPSRRTSCSMVPCNISSGSPRSLRRCMVISSKVSNSIGVTRGGKREGASIPTPAQFAAGSRLHEGPALPYGVAQARHCPLAMARLSRARAPQSRCVRPASIYGAVGFAQSLAPTTKNTITTFAFQTQSYMSCKLVPSNLAVLLEQLPSLSSLDLRDICNGESRHGAVDYTSLHHSIAALSQLRHLDMRECSPRLLTGLRLPHGIVELTIIGQHIRMEELHQLVMQTSATLTRLTIVADQNEIYVYQPPFPSFDLPHLQHLSFHTAAPFSLLASFPSSSLQSLKCFRRTFRQRCVVDPDDLDYHLLPQVMEHHRKTLKSLSLQVHLTTGDWEREGEGDEVVGWENVRRLCDERAVDFTFKPWWSKR